MFQWITMLQSNPFEASVLGRKTGWWSIRLQEPSQVPSCTAFRKQRKQTIWNPMIISNICWLKYQSTWTIQIEAFWRICCRGHLSSRIIAERANKSNRVKTVALVVNTPTMERLRITKNFPYTYTICHKYGKFEVIYHIDSNTIWTCIRPIRTWKNMFIFFQIKLWRSWLSKVKQPDNRLIINAGRLIPLFYSSNVFY